ncbi:MAG TPA: GGDEF domain-containing protein, partial [Telluria sp.]|nr:GGDEF domain-containing protein [Telluria sp.]
MLIAALCLLAPLAFAQPTLTDRLSEIREIGRYVPDKALKMLAPLEAEAAKAPLTDRSEYLVIQSISYLYLGDTKQAMSLTDRLIALGKENKDNTTLVKGQLVKVYILFAMNELKASHQLAWDTEKLANTISDNYLR